MSASKYNDLAKQSNFRTLTNKELKAMQQYEIVQARLHPVKNADSDIQ